MRYGWACVAGAGLLIAVACGGKSTEDLFESDRDAGSSGGSGGGTDGGNPIGGRSGSSGVGGVSGAGGSSGNGGGSGGVGGSGGTAGAAGGVCASESYRAESFPLDMHILFDQSGSMSEQTANGTVWDAAKGALVAFVQSPASAGIGVGLTYFPQLIPCTPTTPGCVCISGICPSPMSSCNVASYAVPEVSIQLLPGVAQQIVSSLASHMPGGGTPTEPALRGAMQYAISHAVATPDRKTVVVLATDGTPNDCSSTVTSVSQVAASGFANDPRILSFVIGIGNTGNLDAIAQAGGTERAPNIDPANAGPQFVDALNTIRDRARACEYAIPKPSSGSLDLQKVNLRVVGGPPATDYIYRVTDAAACDTMAGGWYYDRPVNPSRIVLCSASCATLSQSSASLEILLGCATVTRP